MQVLAQWRHYPRKFGSQFTEHVICGLQYVVDVLLTHGSDFALYSSRYQCWRCSPSSRYPPPPAEVWHQSSKSHGRPAAYARALCPFSFTPHTIRKAGAHSLRRAYQASPSTRHPAVACQPRAYHQRPYILRAVALPDVPGFGSLLDEAIPPVVPR